MRPAVFAPVALLALLAGPLPAHEYSAGGIVIDHPTIPETTPVARAAGGYLALRNDGGEADRLIAVEADFPKVELHETVESDGVARMEARPEGIELPPGETVSLERGGLHVMFMGLSEPLQAGDEVPATLVFEKAGEVEIVFNVEAAHGSAAEMDHGDMEMDADAASN